MRRGVEKVETAPINMILLRKLKTFCLGSRGLVKIVGRFWKAGGSIARKILEEARNAFPSLQNT